jgi:hypothetical protein
VSETTAKDERPASTNPENYDSAWDFQGANTGIATTDVVLTLVRSATLMDAVALSNQDGSSSAGFVTAITLVQGAGAWQPATCGGNACDLISSQTISASMSGVGTTAAGNTVARTSATDNDLAADWSVGASTMGN